ncbi:MAG: hypothetical protein K2W93_10570 [Burkholderiaceae bacterium]|nr:hypothetical protein [Burkholderiaceae bacterium]
MQHLSWLVDTCPSCLRRLQWSRIGFQECRCGHDLRSIDSVAVHQRIQACVLSGQASLTEIRILGALALYGTTGKPGKKVHRSELNEVKAQLMAGVELVESWPSKFVEALDRHRFGGVKDGVAQLLTEAFPRLTKLVKLIPEGALRQRVQIAIDDYCSGSLTSSSPIVGRNAVLRTGPMTIKQLATKLGRRFESVALALDSQGDGLRGTRVTALGRRRRVVSEADLPKLSAQLREPISIKEAARLTALPAARVRALVSAGLLSEVDQRLVRSEVQGLSRPQPTFDQESDGVQVRPVPVHLALRNWIRVKDTAAFIQALRQGALNARAASTSCAIGDWVTSATDIEAWAKRQRNSAPEELTLSDASAALGLKHDVVRDLIRVGLLKGRFGSARSRSTWCVSAGDIEAFKLRYVPLAVLSREANVRPRDGLAWARSQGIQVVTGPGVDGTRQYFACRLSQPPINPQCGIGPHRVEFAGVSGDARVAGSDKSTGDHHE